MKFLLMRIRLLLTHKQHEDINNKMLFRRRLTKANTQTKTKTKTKTEERSSMGNRDEVIEPAIEYAVRIVEGSECQGTAKGPEP